MNCINENLNNHNVNGIDENNPKEQTTYHLNNNSQYDLLLCSIYIISEYTNYNFNQLVNLLNIGDIIYNGL